MKSSNIDKRTRANLYDDNLKLNRERVELKHGKKMIKNGIDRL